MSSTWRAAAVALCLAAAGCTGDTVPSDAGPDRRLLVLGIDGLDPQLLRQGIAAGALPNFARLAERGDFVELGTTWPPQSPVAWSDFITGAHGDAHGIFDFVHRDLADLSPTLSTSTAEPGAQLALGKYAIPIGAGDYTLHRAGTPFWRHLAEHEVPATIYKVPANFPTLESGARTLSGMGTPDLMGTYGSFQLFTEDRAFFPEEAELSGGRVDPLVVRDGVARDYLFGPPNPFRSDGYPAYAPLRLVRDDAGRAVLVEIGDERRLLVPGEWSDWVPVAFDALPGVVSIAGMVRLHLRSARPLELYVSPVNVDPLDPILPIAAPAEFAGDLAAAVGRYYTQGMPEDTKALAADALSEAAFLAQAGLILDERRRALRHLLDGFERGLLFFYVSTVDQVSHVFWRDHEAHGVLRQVYQRVDALLGEVLERIEGTDTSLLVMSDHGFAAYDWQINLNTFLLERGLLSLRAPDDRGPGPWGHVDWSRTRAYAMGLNQVFLNRAGREPHGVVTADESGPLLEEIERLLVGWRAPQTGALIVRRVHAPKPGAFADRAPDLIVGFERGYRSSDDSALGVITPRAVRRNRGRWSGDHCMDPAVVPGVLLSNRRLSRRALSLVDLAPTILDYFDVPVPAEMTGGSVFSQGGATTRSAR